MRYGAWLITFLTPLLVVLTPGGHVWAEEDPRAAAKRRVAERNERLDRLMQQTLDPFALDATEPGPGSSAGQPESTGGASRGPGLIQEPPRPRPRVLSRDTLIELARAHQADIDQGTEDGSALLLQRHYGELADLLRRHRGTEPIPLPILRQLQHLRDRIKQEFSIRGPLDVHLPEVLRQIQDELVEIIAQLPDPAAAPPPETLEDLARRHRTEVMSAADRGEDAPTMVRRFQSELEGLLRREREGPDILPEVHGRLADLLAGVEWQIEQEAQISGQAGIKWQDIARRYVKNFAALVGNGQEVEPGPASDPESALEIASRHIDEVDFGPTRRQGRRDWERLVRRQSSELEELLQRVRRSDGTLDPSYAALETAADRLKARISLQGGLSGRAEIDWPSVARQHQRNLARALRMMPPAQEVDEPATAPGDDPGSSVPIQNESRAAPRLGEVTITREGPRFGAVTVTPEAPRLGGESLITRPAPRVPEAGSGTDTCLSLPASTDVLRSSVGCIDEALRGRAGGVGAAGCLSGSAGGLEALLRGQGCGRGPTLDVSRGAPSLLPGAGVGSPSLRPAAAAIPAAALPRLEMSVSALPSALSSDTGSTGVDLGGGLDVPGPGSPAPGDRDPADRGKSDEDRAAEIAAREAAQERDRAKRDEAQRLEQQRVEAEQQSLVDAAMATHEAAVQAGEADQHRRDEQEQARLEEERRAQEKRDTPPSPADPPADPQPVTGPARQPYRAPESDDTEWVDVPEELDVSEEVAEPEVTYAVPPVTQAPAPEPEPDVLLEAEGAPASAPPVSPGSCEGLTGHNYGECLETSDGRLNTSPVAPEPPAEDLRQQA